MKSDYFQNAIYIMYFLLIIAALAIFKALSSIRKQQIRNKKRKESFEQFEKENPPKKK